MADEASLSELNAILLEGFDGGGDDRTLAKSVHTFSGGDSPGGLEGMSVPRPPFPSPATLSAFRRSIEIDPDTYGEAKPRAAGHLQQTTMSPQPNPPLVPPATTNTQVEPPRNPKAAYCIVFSDTAEACLAARAAGMRTVGVASDGQAVGEALESAADGACVCSSRRQDQ